MTNDFKKLSQLLSQKNINPENWLAFLECQHRYELITTSLKAKNIDLQHYKNYLEARFTQEQYTTEQNLSAISNKETLEWRKIEQLGTKLLGQARINLKELNQFLQDIPKLSSQKLLQKLVKERKIKAIEYLEMFQETKEQALSSESNEVKIPFRLRQTKKQIEFFLDTNQQTKTFGSYKILAEIGRGGMGIVYKAYHPQLNQIVALKILREEKQSPKAKKRFNREIQMMARLNHPHIVQILDSGTQNGENYFVMEFVKGVSLEAFAKEKNQNGTPKTTRRSLLVLMQKILLALEEAHSINIIHRDIKLDNIFVTPTGEPKIGDFGLAKEIGIEKASQVITQEGILLGTVQFMSPEQAKGELSALDARTDLYSLAVCFYKLLTNKFPYESTSLHQLVQQIIVKDPLPPSKLTPQIHPDLDAIFLKALEKEKENRYFSAREFAEDIERFLSGYPIQASTLRPNEKLIRWGKRNKAKMVLSMFILTIPFLLMGSLFWIKTQEKRTLYFQFLQQAKEKLNQSKHSKEKGYHQESNQAMLNALNHLNQALRVYPRDPTSEKIKKTLCLQLLNKAYQNQSYYLAAYVIRELQNLSILSRANKEDLKQQLQRKKNKKKDQHLQRLTYWARHFKTQKLSESEELDALHEIAKMTEKEIFQQLLDYLQEGTEFILNKTAKETTVESPPIPFYSLIVKALGRLEKPAAAAPLGVDLAKTAKKLAIYPRGQRPLVQIHYATLLANALAALQSEKHFPMLHRFRWELGENSNFWKRTKFAYRKLSLTTLKNPIAEKLDDFKNLQIRGLVFKERREYQKAIEAFNKAIQINPKANHAYNSRGLTKYEQKDFQGAIQDYTIAIKINPTYGAAYSNRALAKKAIRDFKGALEDYSQAIKFSPKTAEIYNNRGNLKDKIGDFRGAIIDFNKAIELDPNYALAYNNRGFCKQKVKDFSGALLDLKKAIQLDPKGDLPYNNLGNLFLTQKQYDQAIQYYNKCIALNPNSVQAYSNRGLAKRRKGDLAGSIQDYTTAIKMNPRFYTAYSNRALTKRAKKDYQGAIKDLAIALQINPRYKEAYFNRGMIFILQKKKKEAREDFRKYLILAKPFSTPFARRAKNQIFKLFPELKR